MTKITEHGDYVVQDKALMVVGTRGYLKPAGTTIKFRGPGVFWLGTEQELRDWAASQGIEVQ